VVYLEGRTLLVAASETRGALVFDFDFAHVVGLKGVSVIGSAGTTWHPPARATGAGAQSTCPAAASVFVLLYE
jgi:hypothetical protein